MLCALYAYKGSYAKTLAFNSGDRFLEIGISKDPNWMHVINEGGHNGYVPKNYVAVEQVPPLQMVEMINLCKKNIHSNASLEAGTYSNNENEAMRRLDELSGEWSSKVPIASKKKRPPPQPPSSVPNGHDAFKEEIHHEVATSFMDRGKSLDPPDDQICRTTQSKMLDQTLGQTIESAPHINPEADFLRRLVEEVREKTNISFSTSHQVVDIVLSSLITKYPELSSTLGSLLNNQVDLSASNATRSWQDSVDGRTLIEFLEKLRQCKDDEQQRSWALHEDEASISQFLYKILEILNCGDSEACRAVLCLDDCRALLTLVQYFQMETRWPLRKLLLQIFGCICQLSKIHISYFSASVLPTELCREILDPQTTTEQLGYAVLVLGMILSMGDTLPYTHFSLMNDTFIENLFFKVEHFNKSQETEHLCENYLCLILSFNLQYYKPTNVSLSDRKPTQNPVIRVLSTRREAKFFIEKLLILFNREEDPVALFDFGTRPVNAVLCMMRNIYEDAKAAAHLYTNDEKVVCDILLRQLTDLAPDDKRHYDYLRLLEGVLVNGKWAEHRHLRKELGSKLASICAQNENTTHAENAGQVLNVLRQIGR